MLAVFAMESSLLGLYREEKCAMSVLWVTNKSGKGWLFRQTAAIISLQQA